MTLVLSSLTIAMILTVWFKTDVVAEYAKILGVSSIPVIKSFLEVRKEVPTLSFVDFLSEHYDSFFTRLVTCPICTSTWLGLASILFIPISQAIPSAFLGLFLYLLLGKLLTNA